VNTAVTMRSDSLRLLLPGMLMLALVAAIPAWGALRLTDASGHRLVLDHPAQRVVSLAPFLTELVFDLQAGDRLVGTIAHSDYPEAAKQVPRVGSFHRLDYERIVALQPDLVLLWLTGNGRDELQHLRRLGLKVFAVETTDLAGIARSLVTLGQLLDREAEGRQQAGIYRRRLKKLTGRYADRTPVRVFFQVWDQPLMTAGGPQLITSILRRCGARNIFADQPRPALTVSEEAVIQRRPQAIVATDAGAGKTPFTRWRGLTSIPAVRDHQLILLNTETLGRATPRVLDGMGKLCRALDRVRDPGGRE